jgi:hypothetical protein
VFRLAGAEHSVLSRPVTVQLFSPGIFWSGLIVNLCGCEVQVLQMNS